LLRVDRCDHDRTPAPQRPDDRVAERRLVIRDENAAAFERHGDWMTVHERRRCVHCEGSLVTTRGNVTVKRAPLPSTLQASIVPPWSVTIRCVMASPSPVPFGLLV